MNVIYRRHRLLKLGLTHYSNIKSHSQKNIWTKWNKLAAFAGITTAIAVGVTRDEDISANLAGGVRFLRYKFSK